MEFGLAWKDFCELFDKNLNTLWEDESIDEIFFTSINQDSIDKDQNLLAKNLLKAARLAEKECESNDTKKKKI